MTATGWSARGTGARRRVGQGRIVVEAAEFRGPDRVDTAAQRSPRRQHHGYNLNPNGAIAGRRSTIAAATRSPATHIALGRGNAKMANHCKMPMP